MALLSDDSHHHTVYYIPEPTEAEILYPLTTFTHSLHPKPLLSQDRYFFMEEKRAYQKYNETPTISHATYSFCTQGGKPGFKGGLVRSASCRTIISQSSKISYNLLLIFLTTQNKRIIQYNHSKCLFSY